MPRKALIVGATSAIAQETSKLLAGDGDHLYLVGRDEAKLRGVAGDLRVRSGMDIEYLSVDLDDLERHEEIVERAAESLGGLDTVIVAHGVLGDQQACEREFVEAERVFRTNFLSAASLLTLVGKRFAAERGGTIVGISSVAGDRGRQSNYVYGASKGALSLFLQGLRNRLHAHGVTVITVKPGFVDTPMTAHLERGLLFADPAVVARGIYRAIHRGKSVVYLPWFWRPIMLVVRSIPEFVFKRLTL
jgi:short-subunit dehydrogenase